MFELLGGRLTGSLAVSFIPARTAGEEPQQPHALPLLAHAAVYADGETSWVPAQNQFVELPLSPQGAGRVCVGRRRGHKRMRNIRATEGAGRRRVALARYAKRVSNGVESNPARPVASASLVRPR